ncbi:exodeoxyribonuclease VII large subunit [Gloeothece verrucosa]|uniref:Exodeoxyribonuclease 7 large subunit n=1 Tax=Gloeothece verrucosa (strain PCC 7822) TaxID=497965 RepID=E0U7T1_GLOV7|nr:exodeoxyribonuclease VII large subunit [Gloeothece verrucosa]ADN14893.1 exodeoxyribonuclease VII, large subunit [Gloeothece verrucosa PCC 7822]
MSITFSETALSVSGLTTYIQDLLEGDEQLQQVWVTGEVSSLHDHPKGLFFTLSDPQVDAAISCVVWNSQRLRLVTEPKAGEQLLVLGSIRIYAKRGEYRLTVFQVLAVGEGLQALRYQQLRSRLQAEGLFDAQRKRPLPLHPQTIAVVTSPTAAAWGDIQRTLSQRYPGLHLLLSPATVQGEEAPMSIVAAMERVNRDGRAQVIILARGGGSVEDLSCFNDERVVRAIALSQIPVITGIGHQRDESLADLVADVSVHTPTAAAERVVPDYHQLVLEHRERVNRVVEAVKERLQGELTYVEQLRTRLTLLPSTSRSLAQVTAKCQLLQQKLIALDPQAVLKRGYAVVRKTDAQIVRSTDELHPEQELTIQLGQGFFKVKVTDILS